MGWSSSGVGLQADVNGHVVTRNNIDDVPISERDFCSSDVNMHELNVMRDLTFHRAI